MADKPVYPQWATPRRDIPNPAPVPVSRETGPPEASAGSAEDDAATKWLQDAPAQSAHALQMIGSSQPVPPDPTPPSDFQAALQAAFDAGKVLELNADITLNAPVAVKIKSSFQGWVGLDGHMKRIRSNVSGAPAIRVYMDASTPVGTCARGFFWGNHSLICGGHEAGGIQFDVPFNDRWLVAPEWRSIWIEGAGGKFGMAVIGSIFEGQIFGGGTMNCHDNGMYFGNAGQAGNVGVVSALRYYGGMNRQNAGHGFCVDAYDGPYDVRLIGGYYCENGKNGVFSLAGMQTISDCGFENNHGGAGIHVENRGTVINSSGSTHGIQAYLVDAYVVGDLQLINCSVEGYAGGNPRLAKVAGTGRVWATACGDAPTIDKSGGVRVYKSNWTAI